MISVGTLQLHQLSCEPQYMKTRLLLISVIISHLSYAEEFFNPNFLDAKAGKVADLAIYDHDGLAPGVYRLDIYVNDEYLIEDDVYFSIKEEAHERNVYPCINKSLLGKVIKENEFINLKIDKECVFLNDINSYAKADYDSERQSLNIRIPSLLLKSNARGTVSPTEWDNGINAFLMNYRFSGNNTKKTNDYFLNLTSGLNIQDWRLRDNSTWNYNDGKNNKWKNIATYAEKPLPSLKSHLTIGQLYTQSHIFENVLIKGFQLASDEEMYPDSLRGFAPTIRGVASTTAQVEVTQNNNLIYSTTVSAGPFEINDLYPTTSSGNLFVKITEQNGKVFSYTVPYSTVPNLQREGKSVHSLSIGKSDAKSSIEKSILQASYGLGLSHNITMNTGIQLAEKYQSYAFGLAHDLGDFGAISSDVLFSHAVLNDDSVHNGQSYKIVYAKSLNKYGTNIQIVGYRYSTEGFYTLNEASYNHLSGDSMNDSYYSFNDLRKRKKGKAQISINQRVGGLGNLYISGQNENYWSQSAYDRNLQIGVNGFWEYLNYNLGISYSRNSYFDKANKLLSLNLSIPLGLMYSRQSGNDYAGKYNSLYATSTTTLDGNGKASQQTGVSGTLLAENNLLYSFQQAAAESEKDSMSLSSTFRGSKAEASLGYNHSNKYRQLHYMLNGSIVAFNDGIVFGQPIYGSAIIVSAPGVDGISVENITGVRTDSHGHAIVPYASSYRKNRVALDLTDLNDDTDVNQAVKYVIPTKNALVRADFDSKVGKKAYFTLKRKNGNIIPFGAMVVTNTQTTGIVDQDGKVFLSGLTQSGNLRVKWGELEKQHCTSKFNLSGIDNKKLTQLTLVCHE